MIMLLVTLKLSPAKNSPSGTHSPTKRKHSQRSKSALRSIPVGLSMTRIHDGTTAVLIISTQKHTSQRRLAFSKGNILTKTNSSPDSSSTPNNAYLNSTKLSMHPCLLTADFATLRAIRLRTLSHFTTTWYLSESPLKCGRYRRDGCGRPLGIGLVAPFCE